MKTIGILGITPVATQKHLENILSASRSKLARYETPPVILRQDNFEIYFESRNERFQVWPKLLREAMEDLRAYGAEVISCPANSSFEVFSDKELAMFPELIHIADPLIAEAKKKGVRDVLLLGTNFTVQSGLFSNRAAAHGLTFHTPTSAHQAALNELILQELLVNHCSERAQVILSDILRESSKFEAVALACTELFLVSHLIPQEVLVFDTNILLAEEALRRAMSSD